MRREIRNFKKSFLRTYIINYFMITLFLLIALSSSISAIPPGGEVPEGYSKAEGHIVKDFDAPTTVVSITVIGNQSGVIQNATVFLSNDDDMYLWYTDTNGIVEFSAYQGNYILYVDAEGYESKDNITVNLNSGTYTQTITLDPELEYSHVTVIVQNSTNIDINITGASVILESQDDTYTAVSNGEGVAELFNIPHGTYSLTVTAGGYQDWGPTTQVIDSLSHTIDVNMVPNSGDPEISCTLSVYVYEMADEEDAISGANVLLVDTSNPNQEALLMTTGDDGTAQFEIQYQLPPALYLVTASKEGYETNWGTVDIGSSDENIDISLESAPITDDLNNPDDDLSLDLANDSNDPSDNNDTYTPENIPSEDTIPESTPSNPIITNIIPENGATIYELRPLIRAYYTDPDGIDNSSVILTINGVIINDTIINESYVEFQPDYDFNYLTYNISLTITNLSGNTTIETWSFTIDESLLQNDILFGDLEQGEETINSPTISAETIITSIDLELTIDLPEFEGNIVNLIDKPEEIIAPDGIIYTYLDIKLTSEGRYVVEDEIDTLKFNYRVKWEWINENNIDIDTVQLVRYHNGEWQILESIRTGYDSYFIYYESESPGCSTFAIVGTQVQEVQEWSSPIPVIPWELIFGVIGGSSIILVIVLFKAKYIYTDQDKEQGKKKEKPKRVGILSGLLIILFWR